MVCDAQKFKLTVDKEKNVGMTFFFFPFSRATPERIMEVPRLIGAVAAGLRQSHSNTGFQPSLQLTPQLTAMPDP